MINGKIDNTIIAVTQEGLMFQLSIYYKANDEKKITTTNPILLKDTNDLITLMTVIGEPVYENLKNAAVQIEIEDNIITKIANFCDDNLQITLIEKSPENAIESSEENNE